MRAATPEKNAISLTGVGKVFNAGASTLTALENVNLQVRKGSFVALVGPSGCGKSTLLRIIAGLLKPTSGEVALAGVPAQRFRRENKVGFVFQEATLLPWRTALENVLFPMEIMGFATKSERLERANAYLRLVRLDGRVNAYPSELSGGMRQRVSIARALAYDPGLLLMDEPFGALDEFVRAELNDELMRIWEATGTTTVFVTHSLAEALLLADTVVVMSANPGLVAGVLDVELERPRNRSVRSSSSFLKQLSMLEDILHENSAARMG